MRYWVDIPSGWRYGWPKMWDQGTHPDFAQWLKESGCPPMLQNLAEQYSRIWPVEKAQQI